MSRIEENTHGYYLAMCNLNQITMLGFKGMSCTCYRKWKLHSRSKKQVSSCFSGPICWLSSQSLAIGSAWGQTAPFGLMWSTCSFSASYRPQPTGGNQHLSRIGQSFPSSSKPEAHFGLSQGAEHHFKKRPQREPRGRPAAVEGQPAIF